MTEKEAEGEVCPASLLVHKQLLAEKGPIHVQRVGRPRSLCNQGLMAVRDRDRARPRRTWHLPLRATRFTPQS